MNKDELKKILDILFIIEDKFPYRTAFRLTPMYIQIDVVNSSGNNLLYIMGSREIDADGYLSFDDIEKKLRFIINVGKTYRIYHSDQYLKVDESFLDKQQATEFLETFYRKYNIYPQLVEGFRDE